MQETLLAASDGSAPRDVSEQAWLGGILKNVARGRRRQGRNRSQREEIAAVERQRAAEDGNATSAAADAAKLESQRRLLDHVEALPDAQRSAVLARFYEGLPPRRMAQREGVPISTINSRIQRGLKTLRERLDAEHGDRRSWAVWILPLARGGQASKLPAALVGVLLALVAVAVLGGSWWLVDIGEGRAELDDPLAPMEVADAAPEGPSGLVQAPASASTARRPAGQAPAALAAGEEAQSKGPSLTVRLLNQAGEPIKSGYSIGASCCVDMPPRPGMVNEDLRQLVSSPLENGTAVFDDPWGHATFGGGIGKGPDGWKLFEIQRVYLEGPGLAEFEPEASAAVQFFPKQPGEAEDLERTLVLPDRGGVRLELFNSGGQSLEADGLAHLAFPGVAHHDLAGERTYTVPIKDGVAEWQDFATGSRAFEVRVDIPLLGASWTVDGVGPARPREVVTVKSKRPRRAAVTARLVDEAGLPLEVAYVALKFTADPRYPYGGRSIQASSDAMGAVRFELSGSSSSRGQLPPFALHAVDSQLVESPGGLRLLQLDAVHIEENPKGLVEIGAELGDVVLRFEQQVDLLGRVVNIEGEPIVGAEIRVSTLGTGGLVGLPSGPSGEFSITAPVRDGSTLRVTVPNGGYTPHVEELTPDATDFEIVLQEGPSFYGQLDTGGIKFPERAIMVLMQHETQPDLERFYWPDESGKFEDRSILPGTYTAIVRHQGGQVIDEYPGIHVGATGRFTDERLNGLRLRDHYRVVEVTHSGGWGTAPPTFVVMPHGVSRAGAFVLIGDTGNGLILPTRIAASLTLSQGAQSFRVDDISTIGDTLHAAFAEPIDVFLTFQGEPAAKSEYSLRGEPGRGPSGFVMTLSEAMLKGGSAKVRVPGPGFYRLHVGEIPRPTAGGAVWQTIKTEPHGAPFEIVAPVPGEEAQSITFTL